VTILSSKKFVLVRNQVRFQCPLRYPGSTWSPTQKSATGCIQSQHVETTAACCHPGHQPKVCDLDANPNELVTNLVADPGSRPDALMEIGHKFVS